jgi:hypothetical protein
VGWNISRKVMDMPFAIAAMFFKIAIKLVFTVYRMG